MTRIEFLNNLNKYKDKDELMHYGTIGQKWGVRKWQNYDGTFNEAGKERYFGKSNKSKSTEEEKVGSNKSNIKDYLKFRNKMLKQRTRPDLNQWYRDKVKQSDKQLIKDAKRVDKQQMKMYKNQLKDFYDDPEELVNDLDRMYRIGSNDKKIGGLFSKTPEEKEAKKLAKEAKNIEKTFIEKNNGHEYYDSKKIDEWLDKEENKPVEKAYKDAMDIAFSDTSKELHKLFKDYDDNEDEYVAKDGICNALEDSNKLGDISSVAYWFLADDGNQGSRNSHAYYLNEKGYNAKQINDKLADAEKAMNEGYEVGKKLSQYYNPVILFMPEDLQKKVYNRIHFRYEQQDDYSFNKLLNAAEGNNFNKDNMKAADNISKKLAPSCGNQKEYGWYYFNNAVRNLGLTDTNYKDLTSSDWDKINAEINKIKK